MLVLEERNRAGTFGPKHAHPPGWLATTMEKTCQSPRELENRGDRFLFFVFFSCFGGHRDGYRVRSYCAGWRTLTPHKGNDRIT